MSELMLTDVERRRFALYCRRQAETSHAIVEQMAKAGMPEIMQRREKMLASAYGIVSAHLNSAETVEVRHEV